MRIIINWSPWIKNWTSFQIIRNIFIIKFPPLFCERRPTDKTHFLHRLLYLVKVCSSSGLFINYMASAANRPYRRLPSLTHPQSCSLLLKLQPCGLRHAVSCEWLSARRSDNEQEGSVWRMSRTSVVFSRSARETSEASSLLITRFSSWVMNL